MKLDGKNQGTYFKHLSIFTSRFNKNWFVGLLVSVWFISTIFSFWWFQFRNIQVFDSDAVNNQTVFFESGELGQRLEKLVESDYSRDKKTPVSVIHFWNPDCSCNRFNEVHVKKIISDYADKNVKFTIVVSGSNKEERKQRQILARQVFSHRAVKEIRSDWPMNQGPPSSPAVGVVNSDGELIYFGPYSLGARCAPDKGKFVETVLDGLHASKNRADKKQLNTLAVGCFCPWRSVS